MLLLIVGGIIALGIFIYFKWSMERRRDERREAYRERQEEYLNQLLGKKGNDTPADEEKDNSES